MQIDPTMGMNQQKQQYQYQPPQQQSQYQQQQQYSPGKSPMRAASFPPFPQSEPEMQHSTAILDSPSKMSWPNNNSQLYGQQQQQGYAPGPFTLGNNNNSNSGGGMAQAHGSPPKFLTPVPAPTYSYSFSNAPSIFETLLRESEQSSVARTGSKFHEAVESLQRLNAEVSGNQWWTMSGKLGCLT